MGQRGTFSQLPVGGQEQRQLAFMLNNTGCIVLKARNFLVSVLRKTLAKGGNGWNLFWNLFWKGRVNMDSGLSQLLGAGW